MALCVWGFDRLMPHFDMPSVSVEGGSGEPRRTLRERAEFAGRFAGAFVVRLVAILPYLLWLFLVLAPVGVLAYGLASVAGSVWANLRSGWRDHV